MYPVPQLRDPPVTSPPSVRTTYPGRLWLAVPSPYRAQAPRLGRPARMLPVMSTVPVASSRPGVGPSFAAKVESAGKVTLPVTVSAVLGRSQMPFGDLLKIGPGAVLELDRKVGEAIDIYINNRLVARGEVVLVEEKLGVTMTEMIKAERS